MSAAQNKALTSRSLAGDLLNRALTGSLKDAQITLIQIADSGLLDSLDYLKARANQLVEYSTEIDDRLRKNFPACMSRNASSLFTHADTVLKEADLLRQEHFWTLRDRLSLVRSEAMIADLFEFFGQIEWLLRELDFNGEDVRGKRNSAPTLPPNPYEVYGDNLDL